MKFLKKLLIILLVIVILAGAAVAGGYFFVKKKYGIDLIKTAKELKTLQEPVDKSVLCPNAYTDEDMVDVQQIVNESVADFVTHTQENGYEINLDGLPEDMKSIIKLTDRQVGALAQEVLEQEIGGKVAFGGKNVNVVIEQIAFLDVGVSKTLLNTVLSVDMTPFKAELSKFPLSLLKKFVPDTLYVSSTVSVEKGGEAFSYTVEHDMLTINNLDEEETEDLFHTLEIVFSAGSAESWNVELGTAITDALIGNEQKQGFAYALKDNGASDYAFSYEDGVAYFSVLR